MFIQAFSHVRGSYCSFTGLIFVPGGESWCAVCDFTFVNYLGAHYFSNVHYCNILYMRRRFAYSLHTLYVVIVAGLGFWAAGLFTRQSVKDS